jgi:hypothetical protein
MPYEVQPEDERTAFDVQSCLLKLYEEGEPLWCVHSPKELVYDVAVINLHDVAVRNLLQSGDDNDDHAEFLTETLVLAGTSDFTTFANRKTLRLAAMTHYLSLGFDLRVGDDVFVLGFPRGIESSNGLPIWKRGTIASEPTVPVNELPIMLIDTATREGMSGGPVIARQTRGSKDGKLTLLMGEVGRFVGVYTSRNKGDDEFEAQVGRVWTREHVVDVIRNGSKDLCRV